MRKLSTAQYNAIETKPYRSVFSALLSKVLKAAALSLLLFSSAAALAQQPIRIGALLSVTGPAAFLGDPELKTLQLYVEKINAAGGIVGRKVQLIHYDDGGDAGKANGFVKRLIESDGVDIILGGSTTGTTMATVPLIEKAGVPTISLAGGAVVTEPVKKWIFKTPGTDAHAVEKVYQDMRKRGLTRMALLCETTGVGQSSKQEALKLAPKYGITIVADESFGQKDTDVTPQLTRIRNVAGVQSILVTGFGQGPVVVTRNYAQVSITVPLYHTHGVASQEFINLSGKAAEGVRMSAPGIIVADALPQNDVQRPVLLGYRKEYMQRYKAEPSTFAGYAYDALMIAVEAIKKAGGTDKEKVRAAIEATKGFVGTAGVFNISATDHVGLSLDSFRVVEVKDGRFRLVQ